jgi:hypothetical protein
MYKCATQESPGFEITAGSPRPFNLERFAMAYGFASGIEESAIMVKPTRFLPIILNNTLFECLGANIWATE